MRYLLAVFVLTAAVSAVAQETDPLAILKSNAPLEQKSEALRALAQKATPEAVPVLAPLLTDEKLSHMARYALEPLPYPEAGQALREALGKTSGRLQIGIVNSLAIRKDEQAVPALAALLTGDPEVAQAAAVALGAIANADAQKALEGALSQANLSPVTLQAICDGLLGCAENLAKAEQRDQAVAVYDRLLQLPNAPQQVRTAALRGAVLDRGPEQGLPLLMEKLKGEDAGDFTDALRIAQEISANDPVIAALAEALPALKDERKVRVIEAFQPDDGAVAGSAVQAEAEKGAPEVRVAALHALSRMGYAPALDLITRVATTEDAAPAEAARQALSFFPGKEGDDALTALLKSDNAQTRRLGIELIGQGGLDNPVPVLMGAAKADPDEAVRVAALDALRGQAGPGEMPVLLSDNLLNARSAAEMQSAEVALATLCDQQKQIPGAVVVEKAVYGDLPNGHSADVTDLVRRAVASGALGVDASNANFGDPAPGLVKQLRVDYTDNGTPVSKSVREGQNLRFSTAATPVAIVDAFLAALNQAQGEARPAVVRLLGHTGSPKAFEAVQAAAASDDAVVKDTALRTLCDWPTTQALPVVMDMAQGSAGDALKAPALRGAVRLLVMSDAPADETLARYATLMDLAKASPDDKKAVLSGLAEMSTTGAFELALAQMADPAVKREAILAAADIAQDFAEASREDKSFFNGEDLTGWQGDPALWRFEDGAIVGQSTQPLDHNEFIWSNVSVGDFYLAVDVKLEPNTANAGIQFRSEKINERGQARGYQADAGQDVWGRLYHEQGRGKLDWNDRGEKAVKPGEWNHYEILAVGPAIWTAINGQLGVAFLEPQGERTGPIAFQLHAGPASKASYRVVKLVHNPAPELAGLGPEKLIAELKPAESK